MPVPSNVNPDVTVLEGNVDSFNDPGKGKGIRTVHVQSGR